MGRTCSGSLCFTNVVMGRGAGTPAAFINQLDPVSPSGPEALALAFALPPVSWGVDPKAPGSGVRARQGPGKALSVLERNMALEVGKYHHPRITQPGWPSDGGNGSSGHAPGPGETSSGQLALPSSLLVEFLC